MTANNPVLDERMEFLGRLDLTIRAVEQALGDAPIELAMLALDACKAKALASLRQNLVDYGAMQRAIKKAGGLPSLQLSDAEMAEGVERVKAFKREQSKNFKVKVSDLHADVGRFRDIALDASTTEERRGAAREAHAEKVAELVAIIRQFRIRNESPAETGYRLASDYDWTRLTLEEKS